MNPEIQIQSPVTPQQPTPVPTVEVPKPKNNYSVIIFSALLVMMTGVVAFLGYQNWQLQKQVATLQSIPSPSSTATADPTADWKEITSANWTLKIPNDWHYLGCQPGNSFFIDPKQIHENDNQMMECDFGPTAKIWINKIEDDRPIPTPFVVNNTAEDFGSETFSLEISDKENFVLNEKSGIIQKERYVGGPNEGTVLSVYVKNDDANYIISLSDLSLRDTFLEILSTFKFKEQNTNDDRSQLTQYLTEQYYNQGKQYGRTQDQVVISIDKLEGNYASGNGSFTNDGGDVWFAAKVNDSWFLVEQTQEPPSCKLMTQYNFPKTIYGGCIEK